MGIDREFRKLNLLDLKLVAQMENSFRSNFIVEENARLFLSNPNNWIFACIEESKIIGFAYGYELNRLDNQGNMLYIHEVGVLPQYQNQGIGFQIIKGIKSLCKVRGICRFFLITQQNNVPACKLYEKSGGKKRSDLQDNDVTYFFNTVE